MLSEVFNQFWDQYKLLTEHLHQNQNQNHKQV